MNPSIPVVLFADVDSILRTPVSASRSVAPSLVDVVNRERLPVVFCSSRTRAELERISQELDLSYPFVSENGSGVFVPRGYFGFDVPTAHELSGYEVVEFGKPYGEIVGTLHRTAGRLGVSIVGFNDMSVEEVAVDCGMPLMQARLAKLREYGEPFRVLDPDPKVRRRLLEALSAAGVGCTSAGRYELAGAAIDKGISVGFVSSLFRRAFGSVLTVGLGEGLNDVPLLRRVDVPLVALADDDEVPRLVSAVDSDLVTAAAGASVAETLLAIVDGSKGTAPALTVPPGPRP